MIKTAKDGRRYEVQVWDHLKHTGSMIKLDHWNMVEPLRAGDDYCDSGYAGSEFRIATRQDIIPSLPINIELTGRTLQLKPFCGFLMMRCRVEFPGDCAPSEYTRGWVSVEYVPEVAVVVPV